MEAAGDFKCGPPALGQLAMRAPGTNQHSHAVGQLAEELAVSSAETDVRTQSGARYHDIGKSAALNTCREPAGNQPHDRLKPVQSAKIIISQLRTARNWQKKWLATADNRFHPAAPWNKDASLFSKKGAGRARRTRSSVENDFRYLGPKPQSRKRQ